MIFLDLETRSTVDVTVSGAHVMADDPTLQLLCCSYALGDGPVRTWNCVFADGDPDLAEPIPEDLAAALSDPDCPVLAWNAAFERLILEAVRKRYNIPHIDPKRYICIMALARVHNMAGGLDMCSKAWLPKHQQKLDGRQSSWMWRAGVPLLAKHEDEYRTRQVPYCERDVESARALYMLMLDPEDAMLEQYHASEAVNDRGCMVDLQLIDAAIALSPEVDREIKAELDEITAGQVKPRGPSLRVWLEKVLPSELTDLLTSAKKKRDGLAWTTEVRPSTDKGVRAALLEAMDDYEGMEDVREALALYDEANRAAVTKYAAARDRTDPEEGCLRGQYMFSGAGQTGRYTSTGVQVHNLIRNVPKEALEIISILLTCSTDLIREKTGMTVNQALSRVLRAAFVAEQGRRLVWGDWSSIEARMLPWLSGDDEADTLVLVPYRSGADLYVLEAAGIYGVAVEAITKEMRQIGKVAILALGYQGSVGAFQSMAKNYGVKISDVEAKRIVKAWRKRNAWAKRFWHALEKCAQRAITQPGTVHTAGRIKFAFVPGLLRGTLIMFLPSGRKLFYPEASVRKVVKFEKVTETIVFRHPVYGMSDTYGGKLAENATQGESATLLREALVRCEARGLETVLHTHDELVAETDEDRVQATAEALREEMLRVPDWAPGLPLGAEVEWGSRYKVKEGELS